jgi:hypothetical protein
VPQAQPRRPLGEGLLDAIQFALLLFVVVVDIATDPLLKVIGEGAYRVYWWARRLIEEFLHACYRFAWWMRHLAHRSIARSQNAGSAVLDWVKLRTTHRHLRKP